MDGVGHKVCSILGGGIGEGGDIQLNAGSVASEILAVVTAASSAPYDHCVDVVDVALIILRDRPAKLCFQIGIRLI